MDKLNDLLHDVNDLLPDGSRKSSIRPKSPVKTPLKHTKQEFKNDFHSGGFSFVTDEIWTEKSKAGKLIFESDSNGSRVTWRYKELRSLMGMKFTPVPINRTSDSTPLVVNDSIPVELQFYDSLLLQFVTLKTFNVRELDPVTIDLSNVKIVSSTWRFKMSHFPDVKIQPLSAFALVGSCTLDSIYAPENISNMTLSLNLQNIVIGIEKEVQIRFTKVSTVVEKWPEVTKLHSKQFIRVKALDNKSLRMISVLDKNSPKLVSIFLMEIEVRNRLNLKLEWTILKFLLIKESCKHFPVYCNKRKVDRSIIWKIEHVVTSQFHNQEYVEYKKFRLIQRVIYLSHIQMTIFN